MVISVLLIEIRAISITLLVAWVPRGIDFHDQLAFYSDCQRFRESSLFSGICNYRECVQAKDNPVFSVVDTMLGTLLRGSILSRQK